MQTAPMQTAVPMAAGPLGPSQHTLQRAGQVVQEGIMHAERIGDRLIAAGAAGAAAARGAGRGQPAHARVPARGQRAAGRRRRRPGHPHVRPPGWRTPRPHPWPSPAHLPQTLGPQAGEWSGLEGWMICMRSQNNRAEWTGTAAQGFWSQWLQRGSPRPPASLGVRPRRRRPRA